ncbi:MAG: DNA polymerase IV [Promethearchaeia archaeon]
MSRIIFHCDLDCFFASVEIRDNPDLKGKPVIVGADPKNGYGRGVVSTCSYEARKFGIRSGMPISIAYRKCPRGIYVRPNFEKYQKASQKVMSILKSYSSAFQQVSIDEAYLELTNCCKNFNEAFNIARDIQYKIQENVGITISIGIAPTKTIAKIASDENKPNGITIIRPEEVADFLKEKDITRIPGIGKRNKKHYYERGIKKIGDIFNISLSEFTKLFGKHGASIWEKVHGLDKNKVQDVKRDRKSISREITFPMDILDFNLIEEKLKLINKDLHNKIEKNNLFYRTITLKIRFEGYETYSRSKSYLYHFRDEKYALNIIKDMLNEFKKANKRIRLIGIKISNLKKDNQYRQTNLLQFCSINS